MKILIAKTPVFAPEAFKPDADSVKAMILRIRERTESKAAAKQTKRVSTDGSLAALKQRYEEANI